MSAERVILPTSFMQQQLWLAEQLMPGTSMHNILVANRFQRLLNIEALERTLNEIVRRHDSLRTTFTAVDGHLMQVIHPTLNLTLPIEDLHNLAGIDPQTEVRRIAREQTGKPFNLEQPPLFRMILLRLDDVEHVLLVTMHHLISDGWSLDLIRREIALLYNAYAGGKPSPLSALPIQYADFARGQREWLQGEVFRIQLEYWKRQLAGAPSALELPTDRPRPAVRTFKGAREFRLLPRSLTGALQALAQEEGVTPFMILLAAFKLLLHRYSGQEDIVVGSPIANRNRTELERIIGLFVNTLVLRTDLSGDPSFRELMKRVRETAAGAYSHQETPFERLVQELVPKRRLSHTPLFQVMFVLGNSPTQGKRRRQRSAPLSDRQLSQGDDDIAKFDLTLYISDTDSGLETSFKYSTDLFEQVTISRMLGHFETLLQGIVASPELRLSELPLLSSTERHQLLVAWNQTDKDFGEARLLHRWFEAQVGLTPDAVAVVFENDQLTYSELNDRANRLAHHLQRLGVGPERMVGLCVERSTETVVGLLGILKAGAAYVPLDPQYPKDRLAFMLDDTQATVLLTHQRLLGIMPATEARVVCLDADWEMIAAEPPENPAVYIEPANLAYVLYTSGSTGRPKGVIVEHQQLWNYTAAILERLQLAPGLSFAMVQPLTVDSCLTSIFPPLCTGGVLHVISEERAADAHYLAEYFQYHAVDCLKIAPSHLAALHTASVAQQIMPRQRLVIGGEASRWDWVSALPAVMPSGLVFNHYGPTEATVGVLTFSVEPDEQRQLYVTTPLGRPLANTQIYLLDRRGQPVPVGVPGEIYIGGANVARGYLNRPELTAEMFVPDTFRSGPDRRLYKTGDRARYLADGNLEFLSRTDDQVKIRGFRVELREIEAVLRQHPDVRDALVLSRRDGTSDRLVAYIVGKATRASNAELRGFLGDHLPDYMVPATIVHLEALPRTPHGKVDRQALPVAETEALEQPGAYEPPRNRTEEILAGLWAQVLRLAQVGIHDNFFELGGDSILAIQIIARAAQAGVHFTSRQLFQHQTIAALASVVGSVKSVNAEQGPVTGPVPLTPIQYRFFDQQHAEAHHYNQAFLLHVHDELDPALMARAVQHLLSHHDAFRLRFVNGTTEWDQRCAGPDDCVPFSQHDLSDLSQPQQRKAIRAAAARLQTSLDLSDGPLLRVAYFDLGSVQSSRLLIIVHHLAVDEVSWRILIEDLHTAYGQLKRGEPVALPPKTTSFKYWAERLQKHAQSSELRQELAYRLSESRKPVPPLPVDYPAGRGSNTMATARTVLLSLTYEETYQLLGEVPRIYRTQINDILLAALGHALCRWTGSHSLLINLEGHGREDIFDDVDLSRTVGWFTSVFPVRLELGENTDPAEALESVKAQLRLVPRRGRGYGILRYLTSNSANEELKGLKPEISFNYLGQYDQTLSMTSMVSAAQRAKSNGPAKIDTEADISGSMRGGRASREHLLEIAGSLLRDQLRLACTYSEKVHRRPTIEGLLGATKEALQAILAHSQTLRNAVRTASDHPFELDHPTFDQLTSADPQFEQVYPLSPLQQGMLFHSVYAPGSRAYVGQYQRAFDSLNVESFKRAWARVVRRHPVLRTGFVWKGVAEPLQVVRREVSLSWDEHNWRGLSVSEREARLEAFRIADRQRGFDLSQPPLMRMVLMRTGANSYQFVWTYHLLYLDGWSSRIILREINKFYRAFCAGRHIRLKSPRPYRDYIAWLRQLDPSHGENFWPKYLKGFPASTPLPMDRTAGGSRMQDETDREAWMSLSSSLTTSLQLLARRHHLTLNTLLQAAWALLLSRYSGENDVVFGAVVSGRPTALAGVESMVGLFTNTLPIRVRIPREATLLSWLQEVQTQQVEAREYQHSSLVQLQGWSEVPRGLPLFESVLIFKNYPGAAPAKGHGSQDSHAYERVNYLTIVAQPGSELVLKALYDSRRFENTAITQILQHLRNLLAGITADPYGPIHSLMLTSADERRQLLVDWNNTDRQFDDVDLVRLLERQVKLRPNAPAFICDADQLSYRDLDQKSNQLAHRLKTLGVGPEVVVGICLQRSLDLAIALLGVLKANAAFLPLDPSYPHERLVFMLEDSGAAVLVTRRCFAEALQAIGNKVVFLDERLEELPALPQSHSSGRTDPKQLAYLIYTSGSTGKPKGVAVPLKQILNRLAWMWETYPFSLEEMCCQKTAFSFVDSIWELLGPLLQGVPTVIIPDAVLQDPPRLVECLAKNRVTRIWLVPSFLRMMLDGFPNLQERLPDLRFWVLSGEPLPADLLRRFCRSMPGAVLYNLYGTSEVWDATWYESSTKDAAADLRTVPIGRPIANVKAYVLDKHMQVVPVGVLGELYIGGIGLARGYVNRDELTAEKFIPDTYSDQPGAKIYRTGDIARYLPDGNIEFLGRVDHQVKIRGFRIEVGEIEAVLAQHPAVRQAAVVARDESVHEWRLVAYVVLDGNVSAHWHNVREFLGRRLPAYMVPATFVQLDALPLTPSGKLDRGVLPKPENDRTALQSTFVAPRNPTEEAVAKLWIEMLAVDRVGIYDSFFELGGHSLRAMQLVSRIRDAFNVEVSLRQFFESPTVAGLSGAITEAGEQQPADFLHESWTIMYREWPRNLWL